MSTALWVAQILLALAIGAAGVMKLTQPREKLLANMGWVEDFSGGLVKFVGGVEVLGALGLILPAVTDIAPILVPIAATCLALDQALAAVVHGRRKEPRFILGNAVLFATAAFVAWGGSAITPYSPHRHSWLWSVNRRRRLPSGSMNDAYRIGGRSWG